jgi:hypothetical protein
LSGAAESDVSSRRRFSEMAMRLADITVSTITKRRAKILVAAKNSAIVIACLIDLPRAIRLNVTS